MWWSLKKYYLPKTVRKALQWLKDYEPHAALIAGGTSLVAEHDPTIEVLIGLNALKLDYIEARTRRLGIGALTTLQTLVSHPNVKRMAGGLLSQVAEYTAPLPIRNRATLGGTLVVSQGTSELVLALLVLEAQIVLRIPDRRVLSLADFLAHRKEYLSAPALIGEVLVPIPPEGSGAAMSDVRPTWRDRPIVNAAALVSVKDSILQSVRLALGGVAPVSLRFSELEAMLTGAKLNDATLERVLQEIEIKVNPPYDDRASVEYRRAMAGVMVTRALLMALEQAGKE